MTPDPLAELEAAWADGRLAGLAAPQEQAALDAALGPGGLERLGEHWGPGVVVGSGGSSGGRRWCLQPLAHLQASAAATAHWLRAVGVDPAACLHLNPLPLHHVSGLLPWLRARQWGGAHRVIPPAWMRQPRELAARLPLTGPPGSAAPPPALLSLVPTQLARLMVEPAGLAWLRCLAVIWVGGAPLPPALAARARRAGLRLSPCYGATETAAMVAALPPERFLAGVGGCGPALAGVELRLAPGSVALEVRCDRLSPGWVEAGVLQPLPGLRQGWWRSGDGARLSAEGLRLLGRIDGAIHSGGETVFPEQIEARIRALAAEGGWPLQEVLLLALPDPDWGERLAGLVRPAPGADGAALCRQLAAAAAGWAPAERPRRWLCCPGLEPSPLGKWERSRWQRWLLSLEAGHPLRDGAAADGHPE
ncbi:AMP-binding protein [Cyanobium sp. NIES-981]|uniref:AMP-binding protein n=1 Tax=Cyanobium sp. NIES-981 TaxID=1851505 RepID=UPI0007DD007F|nr:AMP-binding protein [Cyanobium sp. NIES-981]SBO44906.1 O-succinylbenzoic acid-CoA ligase [Cyanobium sp. NIES-981]